jgi:hypothetical protein
LRRQRAAHQALGVIADRRRQLLLDGGVGKDLVHRVRGDVDFKEHLERHDPGLMSLATDARSPTSRRHRLRPLFATA